MIRTQLIDEVRQWLQDTGYSISLDTIINDFQQDNISFTPQEIDKIEMMFLNEKERGYEKQAEIKRMNEELLREWQVEMKYQEAEWRLSR